MADLFILAAEPSADAHGARLIEELLKKRPHLSIAAVAGPRMRALPIEITGQMEELQVMGFIDVFLALPKIIRQFFAIRQKILDSQPKAVVCIDYPGFNLRLEYSLRKKGYRGKLIHYICPTVWAWGKGRIPQMAQTLDLLLSIFPFEPACFQGTSLPVEYVGHPLTRAIANFSYDPNFRKKFSLEGKILALFPGSRKVEIERNFPLQLEAVRQLDPALQIAVSCASEERGRQIQSLAPDAVLIPPEHTYDLMREAHLALAKSGTVTLELALHETPTVVHYAIRPIDLFLARHVFRIHLPFYCIVNIIASKKIYPELFGPRLTGETLFAEAVSLLQDLAACQKRCREVKQLLGELPASETAAIRILSLLDS